MGAATFYTDADGNVVCIGKMIPLGGITLPNGAVTNVMLAAAAGISASKLECPYHQAVHYSGTIASGARRLTIRWVKGATGDLRTFTASIQTAPTGSSTVTVDLQVDGVSILDSVITFTSASAVNTENEGVVSTAAVTDGSRVEVVITGVPSGSDACGADVMAQCDWNEDYNA